MNWKRIILVRKIFQANKGGALVYSPKRVPGGGAGLGFLFTSLDYI